MLWRSIVNKTIMKRNFNSPSSLTETKISDGSFTDLEDATKDEKDRKKGRVNSGSAFLFGLLLKSKRHF